MSRKLMCSSEQCDDFRSHSQDKKDPSTWICNTCFKRRWYDNDEYIFNHGAREFLPK